MRIVHLLFFLAVLAFFFLWMAHEFLKRRIRSVSGHKNEEPNPPELDYPFFKMAEIASLEAPGRRRDRGTIQIADRNTFIRSITPGYYDKFIMQERLLRLMFWFLTVFFCILVLLRIVF